MWPPHLRVGLFSLSQKFQLFTSDLRHFASFWHFDIMASSIEVDLDSHVSVDWVSGVIRVLYRLFRVIRVLYRLFRVFHEGSWSYRLLILVYLNPAAIFVIFSASLDAFRNSSTGIHGIWSTLSISIDLALVLVIRIKFIQFWYRIAYPGQDMWEKYFQYRNYLVLIDFSEIHWFYMGIKHSY